MRGGRSLNYSLPSFIEKQGPLFNSLQTQIVSKIINRRENKHVKKKKCKCNLFTHGAPRSSKNSFRNARAFQDRIGIWKCWFLRRGENICGHTLSSINRLTNTSGSSTLRFSSSRNGAHDVQNVDAFYFQV